MVVTIREKIRKIQRQEKNRKIHVCHRTCSKAAWLIATIVNCIICFIIIGLSIYVLVLRYHKDSLESSGMKYALTVRLSYDDSRLYFYNYNDILDGEIELVFNHSCYIYKGIHQTSVLNQEIERNFNKCLKDVQLLISNDTSNVLVLFVFSSFYKEWKEFNAVKFHQMLEKLKTITERNSFDVNNINKHMKVMAMNDENVFSLVAINASKAFEEEVNDIKSANDSLSHIGIINMGVNSFGVMLAIDYNPIDRFEPLPYFAEMRIGEKMKRRVYLHSLPCHGIEEIHNRFFARLMQNMDESSMEKLPYSINNPCAPVGETFFIPIGDIVESGCSRADLDFDAVSIFDGATQIAFEGIGDYSSCKWHFSNILIDTTCWYAPKCSFHGYFMPLLDGYVLYGIGQFSRLLKYYRTFGGEEMTIKNLEKFAENACTGENVPSHVHGNAIEYCLMFTYASRLLKASLHMNDEMVKNIIIVETYDEIRTDWSFGYTLQELRNKKKAKIEAAPSSSSILVTADHLPLASLILMCILYCFLFLMVLTVLIYVSLLLHAINSLP
ncbi:hypothetical protein SNEBB_003182 [Seison nebaliae]|nr:hypothetical protein SNEBB_003182 [Seison nebaliae]